MSDAPRMVLISHEDVEKGVTDALRPDDEPKPQRNGYFWVAMGVLVGGLIGAAIFIPLWMHNHP